MRANDCVRLLVLWVCDEKTVQVMVRYIPSLGLQGFIVLLSSLLDVGLGRPRAFSGGWAGGQRGNNRNGRKEDLAAL